MSTKRVWCEVDRRFILIEVVFSGKRMPYAGEIQAAWRGSGSLANREALEHFGHGTLPSPEELRGKAPGTWGS